MQKLILMLMLAGLGAWAQSPQDRVVIDAWRYVRRADAYQYPTGLVAYYSFDSVSGNTVFDTFGSNDGTAVGTPLFGSSYGKYLEGVNLNGSSQYISAPNSVIDGLVSMSIAYWFKTTTANLRVMSIGRTGAEMLRTGVTSGSLLFFTLNDGTSYGATGTNIVTDGEWHHCAATYDASTIRLYYDGVEVSTESKSDFDFSLSVADLVIGARYTKVDIFYDGSLDEITVFNRALSSNEVYRIGNTNNPVFYTP